MLIPAAAAAALAQLKSRPAVVDLAQGLGIHPCIVVGRMQHDGIIEPSWMNDLKVSFRVADDA